MTPQPEPMPNPVNQPEESPATISIQEADEEIEDAAQQPKYDTVQPAEKDPWWRPTWRTIRDTALAFWAMVKILCIGVLARCGKKKDRNLQSIGQMLGFIGFSSYFTLNVIMETIQTPAAATVFRAGVLTAASWCVIAASFVFFSLCGINVIKAMGASSDYPFRELLKKSREKTTDVA